MIPHRHRAKEWMLLSALVAMWGSSFMFIKIGVATVPPSTLVASRLVLGALIPALRNSSLVETADDSWRDGGPGLAVTGSEGGWECRVNRLGLLP